MHIVVLAWLYVILMMALASKSVAAGIALFTLAGIGPVLLYVALAARRLRARRADASRGSGLERNVNAGDDRDAEADQ